MKSRELKTELSPTAIDFLSIFAGLCIKSNFGHLLSYISLGLINRVPMVTEVHGGGMIGSIVPI